MSARKFTDDDRSEIKRRVRLRLENSNKQIMADFRCSRSYVDTIAKEVAREIESNLLSYESSATCDTVATTL